MREALAAFVHGLETGPHDVRGFILHQDGHEIASGVWSPYSLTRPHEMYSLSKSFTSMAFGFAQAEGRASLDDKVVSFFPEDVPADASENLRNMRVRDLLAMATGHEEDTTAALFNAPDGNWPGVFFKLPVQREPGTHFLYNTGATYMVSAIVQKVTGERVTQYLRPRLFDPLDIRYVWSVRDPRGVDVGGSGMRIPLADIAKVGEVVRKNDGSILPADYMRQATSFQVSNGEDEANDWNQGYGFQFWRCTHNAFRGDGAFGQFMISIPEHDASLAMFCSSDDLGGVLALVWEHLLPMLATRPTEGPVHFCRESASSPDRLSKVWKGSFEFEENDLGLESLSLDTTDGLVETRFKVNGVQHALVAGDSRWREDFTGAFQFQPEAVCTRVGERDGDLVLSLRFPEMTQSQWIRVALSEGSAEVEFRAKNRFGRCEYPVLKSR